MLLATATPQGAPVLYVSSNYVLFFNGRSFLLLFILIGLVFWIRHVIRNYYAPKYLRFRPHVLITGCDARSSAPEDRKTLGLGANMALDLFAAGYNVIACCHTDDGATNLNELYSSMKSILSITDSRPCFFLTPAVDVTSDESVASLVKYLNNPHIDRNSNSSSQAAEIPAIHGTALDIDILINNAGIFDGSLVEMTPISVFDYTMQVNFIGTVRMCKEILPFLRRTKYRRSAHYASVCPSFKVSAESKDKISCSCGIVPAEDRFPGLCKILNVSSFLGKLSLYSTSAYSASKHAIESFSDSLRTEVSPSSIKVITIRPGTMNTPMVDDFSATFDFYHSRAPYLIKSIFSSEFRAAASRAIQIMRLCSQPASSVSSGVLNVVSSRFPSYSYSIGIDSIALGLIAKFIPQFIQDFACMIVLGSPRSYR